MHKTEDLIAKLQDIRSMVDECLTLMTSRTVQSKKHIPGPITVSHETLSFELNERAFVKRYCVNLTSAGKFVLILAYLAHGNESKEVSLTDIKKLWNKMTADTLLGIPFNRKYSTEAKENGWANSPKQGHYSLAKGWKGIFRK